MLKTLKLPLTALLLVASLSAFDAAAAVERHIAIVLDRSGSMTAMRPAEGRSRFESAKHAANADLTRLTSTSNYVSIWTFEGTGFIPVLYFSNDFTAAKTLLMGLNVGSGTTPLASTLCSVVDSLRAFPAQAPGNLMLKELLLFSDGEENSSPPGSQCAGPSAPSTDVYPNYTAGTWQAKVVSKFFPPGSGPMNVIVHARVFADYFTLTGTGSSTPERNADGSLVQASHSLLPSSFYAFLTGLVQNTGGSMTLVLDSQPAPRTIAGDTNGDFCVDNSDLNLVLANYGYRVPPGNPNADLNFDGVIDYDDYSLVLSNFGRGIGCTSSATLSDD